MILVQNPQGTEKCFINASDLSLYDGWTILGEGEAARPVENGVWTGSNWEVPLGVLKDRLRARVNSLKAYHEDAGVMTPHGLAQSDLDSRGKITGLVTGAMVCATTGQDFTANFTMADNSVVVFDAPEMMAFGMLVLGAISTVHDHASTLKSEIEAATTAADLEAIEIEEGWPN